MLDMKKAIKLYEQKADYENTCIIVIGLYIINLYNSGRGI